MKQTEMLAQRDSELESVKTYLNNLLICVLLTPLYWTLFHNPSQRVEILPPIGNIYWMYCHAITVQIMNYKSSMYIAHVLMIFFKPVRFSICVLSLMSVL